jgi:hypothetical protein
MVFGCIGCISVSSDASSVDGRTISSVVIVKQRRRKLRPRRFVRDFRSANELKRITFPTQGASKSRTTAAHVATADFMRSVSRVDRNPSSATPLRGPMSKLTDRGFICSAPLSDHLVMPVSVLIQRRLDPFSRRSPLKILTRVGRLSQRQKKISSWRPPIPLLRCVYATDVPRIPDADIKDFGRSGTSTGS